MYIPSSTNLAPPKRIIMLPLRLLLVPLGLLIPLSKQTTLRPHQLSLSMVSLESMDINGGVVESRYVENGGAWTGVNGGGWRGGRWWKVDTAAVAIAVTTATVAVAVAVTG